MIYLDNAATTKPFNSALEKAKKFNNEEFFNPSALYKGGLSNAKEIKTAKENLLRSIGATSDKFEVIFTSCGTESDNQAVFGTIKRGVFVTDLGEHSAIYKSFLELKNRGIAVYFVGLNKDGSVNQEELYNLVKSTQIDFVSIMHVNNETGAINDVNTIAKNLKNINPKLIFHSDGVQAFGKIPFRISSYIDLYSISAHKINALKGVGALVKRKNLSVKPIIFGGGQENGLRSGTENLFGIKVFEYAFLEHFENIKVNYDKTLILKNYIIDNIDKELFTIISSDNSSPYILTVSARGIRGEVLMHSLETEGVIVGNGSACSSKNRFSRVIEACGYKEDVLDGVVRISFSTESTLDEIKKAVEILNSTTQKLKRIMRWLQKL